MIVYPELHVTSRGPDVGNWQRFLNARGFRDARGLPLLVDEDFGGRTFEATRAWQAAKGRVVTGKIANLDRGAAEQEGFIPFVQARNYTRAARKAIDLIVIHDMEYPERPRGAEWCASFFAASTAPKASAHYCIDNAETIQCVREEDVAWHAPGGNRNGIGIEHAGYADQTRAQWLDDYSLAELARSARLVAELCRRWKIPIARVSPEELREGRRGICGHVDITIAFNQGHGHTDPGANFPWDKYVASVEAAALENVGE